MKQGKVVLICGLPGSGKSTLSKKLENKEGFIRLCPDDWMEDIGVSLWNGEARSAIEQRFWRLAQKLASQGITSILENGFWSKKERDNYLKIAREQGFKIELRALYISKEETRERLEARGAEADNLIIKERLDSYFDAFEVPSEAELALYDN